MVVAPSTQYSNLLFRFMKNPEHLVRVLELSAFPPRYSNEDLSYLHLEDIQVAAIAMVCFCDIKRERLGKHASPQGYGEYGIALRKEWGLANNVQPVQYINGNSEYSSTMRLAFNNAFSSPVSNDASYDVLTSFLATQIAFSKPLYEGGICLEDECEWRYVPASTEKGMKQIYGRKLPIRQLDDFNAGLENATVTYLPFSKDDVMELCLAGKAAEASFRDALSRAALSDEEKTLFISKIQLLPEEIVND